MNSGEKLALYAIILIVLFLGTELVVRILVDRWA
jgi:hypothetical protein